MNASISRRCCAAALVPIAGALVACGDAPSSARDGARASTQTQAKVAGKPARPEQLDALEANAAEAGRIVGEGAGALRMRLATLKGHPVVVNQWASWCPPCAAEFGFFTTAAAKYRGKVAFVGVDYRDERSSAEAFLRDQSSGFPSIFDPDGDATRSLGGGRVSPSTFFIGPGGQRAHTKPGAYTDVAQLDADIRRHALGAP